jgi:cell wall-associated NlpC family hydrolase
MLNKEIAACPSPASFAEVSRSDIIKTAKRLIGIPYLWGGNSAKGNDCSGFTQTVFKANGLQLPRDARQQALIGGEVIALPDFSNVLPGDLIFFGTGERITHVGISLGGFQFIHQDSDVNIASFNEKDETFNSFRKKTLKKIKRVLSK